MSSSPATRSGSRTAKFAVLVGVGALTLVGCAPEQVQRGWLPGPEGMTEHSDTLVKFWVDTWIAALIVGVLVWALLLWCVIVYRKRKNDNTLPVQLRYHLPLELLYTFVPLVMVGVLFYYTAAIQDDITSLDPEPDHEIEVIGKQWSFDFNYVDEDVWDTGMPWDNSVVPADGVTLAPDEVPTLVLPVGESVEFVVLSRDVVHSFWVPAFLYKLDMIPGERNVFQITPGVEGSYIGKCAELCGEFHGNMLFNVEVVSAEEYQAHIESLREAGQTGQLDQSLDRTSIPSGQRSPTEGEED